MIYEYNPKERLIKVDDRIVYLSTIENEIMSRVYSKGYITPLEVNIIIANGYATDLAVDKYMKKLSDKIFGKEVNIYDKRIFSK